MQSTPSLPLFPGPLIRSGSTWYGPIYGSNRTKLCTYAKLNCLKYNCLEIKTLYLTESFEMELFFDIETGYLCQTELFEIELLVCIKMDLILNNLQ